jgi:NADPH:quinone reductase-like Zn-dependent oxidoreductase
VFQKIPFLPFPDLLILKGQPPYRLYLTAYQLICVMGGLKKRESVLIHNAGGGVGLTALDISLHLEATTYGTSSVGKRSFLMERGLKHPMDYRNQDFFSSIMSLTGGKGVEMGIDPIGGKNWKKSYRALRSTGRLGMFGVSTVTESTWGDYFSL